MKSPMMILKDWASVIIRERPTTFRCGDASFEFSAKSGGDYFVHDSIAYFPVFGPLIKGAGSGYGVTDQQDIAALADRARLDPIVSGGMMIVDSPGGTVSGSADMGDALARFAQAKPLVGYAQDLAASAGYWALSQANKVFANRTAIVGSIGVVTELVDASAFYEKIGVKVIPIVTGNYKAAGGDANPITPEVVAYFQSNIDALFEHFVDAVHAGRGMSKASIKALEAAVFVGEAAVEKKLVDKIGSLDEAMSSLKRMIGAGKERSAKTRAMVESMESAR